jgi:hypothetical protein
MEKHNFIRRGRKAVTLVELLVAMALMVLIFTAIVPQFRAIRNSMASNEASATIIQNGRVLEEHINRNLSTAKQIVSVSASGTNLGFIIFKDVSDVQKRYMVSGGYVVFGTVGSEEQLAGPVSKFQVSSYFIDPSTTLTTDANLIRLVKVDTDFTNSNPLGSTKSFTAYAYVQSNQNTGFVGWWKLDETSGTAAADSSGSGNNGTLVNMTSPSCWVTGQIGNALVFDGLDDYVNLGTNSSLNFGSSKPFTIAAWVKTTEDYGLIVSFRSSTDGGPVIDLSVGYEGATADPGKAMILVRQDGGSGGYAHVKSGTSVKDGQWHHVAAVRGSGSTIELFLDGVSQGTSSGSESGGAITTNLRAIGSERRWVSDSYGTSDQRYLVGTIDDVRIYNRALTAAEIAQLATILKYQAFTEKKVSSDSNTAIVIQKPSGTVQGNLLIAAVATDGSTTFSLPSGWTEINQGNSGSQVTLGVWYKIAGSSEPANYTFTWSGGNEQAYGWIMQFTGNDTNPATVINNVSTPGQSSGTATPSSPAVNTTVDNCIILRLGAFDDSDITVDDPGLHSPINHTAITMEESGGGPAGLVGYWDMDETSGATAMDSSDNGNDGTLYNMSSPSCWGIGQIGNTLRFDGSNDYVSLPIGSVINSLTNCTIASWVNWDGGGSWQRIWDFGTGETVNMFLTPRNGSTGTLRFAITTNGSSNEQQITKSGSSPLSTGWHHIAVTIDTSNHTHKMYLDGALAAQNTSGTLTPHSLGTTNHNYLGRSNYSADPYLDGRLDDVRIYNRVLSTTEVTALYQWSGDNGIVSGGAGYVKQSAAGSSGTSNFSLTTPNEARMITIAIAPANSTDDQIKP